MSVPYGGFISVSFLRSSELCLLPRLYLNHTCHKLRYVSQTNCSEQYCQPKFPGFLSSVNRFAKVRRKSSSFENKTGEQLLKNTPCCMGIRSAQSVQWLGFGLNSRYSDWALGWTVGTVTGLWAEQPKIRCWASLRRQEVCGFSKVFNPALTSHSNRTTSFSAETAQHAWRGLLASIYCQGYVQLEPKLLSSIRVYFVGYTTPTLSLRVRII